ncbi:MAG: 50S ribosomal protein L21 [Candidatus Sericytochromatia bacterium]
MYAVIKTGGKQYKVEENKWVDVELLHKEEGEAVSFDEVLLVSNGDNTKVGTPTVANAKVTGKVVKNDRKQKVIVYKMRPKKHYRRKNGHRQHFTRVMIEKIEA